MPGLEKPSRLCSEMMEMMMRRISLVSHPVFGKLRRSLLGCLSVAGFGFYDAGVDMIQAQRTRKHVVGKSSLRIISPGAVLTALVV
jgi:hypothetical protein